MKYVKVLEPIAGRKKGQVEAFYDEDVATSWIAKGYAEEIAKKDYEKALSRLSKAPDEGEEPKKKKVEDKAIKK